MTEGVVLTPALVSSAEGPEPLIGSVRVFLIGHEAGLSLQMPAKAAVAVPRNMLLILT